MKLSIIIPVRDEEENLAQAISRIRMTAPRAGAEVIVADGGSLDKTVELARSLADKVVEVGRPGRASQMQAGALAASGDLLLFLHADTRLPGDWRERLREAWSRADRPAATAFKLGFDSPAPVYRLIAWAANLRTALTGVPHGDQAIAVAREVFFEAGGLPPVPLMEEYFLIRRLKVLGSVRILPGAVSTSVRRYERNGPLRNALRNAGIILLFHLGVAPDRLERLYR
jgi:rSAM/selenodomain-associated transferase 2